MDSKIANGASMSIVGGCLLAAFGLMVGYTQGHIFALVNAGPYSTLASGCAATGIIVGGILGTGLMLSGISKTKKAWDEFKASSNVIDKK